SIHTAGCSCTVESAISQKHSSGGACRAIVATSESVNHLKIPTSSIRTQFVNRSYTVSAASWCHAIDISEPIYCNSRAGAGAVVDAGEGINNFLAPSWAGFG